MAASIYVGSIKTWRFSAERALDDEQLLDSVTITPEDATLVEVVSQPALSEDLKSFSSKLEHKLPGTVVLYITLNTINPSDTLVTTAEIENLALPDPTP